MTSTGKVLLVAALAATLGAAAGLLMDGPGPLLRSEAGQRALQGVLRASAPEPPADLPIARAGDTVAPFELPALDGTPVRLPQAYLGRPVLVNVWASWCGPCIKEMPELERFWRSQSGVAGGTRVVGIALDESTAVGDFLRRVPVSYPILIDSPGPRDAGVRMGNPKGVLPYTVLLDAHGRVLKQKIGPFEAGEIESWVE